MPPDLKGAKMALGPWINPHRHPPEDIDGNTNEAWPVGSIFISTNPQNPSESIGVGTWISRNTNFNITGQGSPDVYVWERTE